MTTIIMISNNSSVIINNSRDDNCSETTNVKRSQASPTSSTGSSISSRNSFSPTLDQRKHQSSKNNDNNNKNKMIKGMTKKIINKNSCTKNSLSTLESEDSEFNQSSAASTLSSTGGNSSSTSGIANSITYFPSLDEEFEAESFVETSTPVANKQPLHSLRFFVDPTEGSSKKSMTKTTGNQCKNSNYDTRSLDRRRVLLRENLLTIKSPEIDPKAYCTLRRRSLHREHEKLTTGSSSKPSSNNCISNVSLEFPSSSGCSSREFDETHRVRKVVKSVISKETTITEPNIVDESSVVKNNNELVNSNNNCDTSDDDDLSHAEELSYDSSQVTSSEVESLTGSNSNLNSGIVLPTGWHRHPGHHHHHHQVQVQNSNNLGPLDEIVHAEEIEDENCNEIDSEISDHIYSTVVKSKESSESSEGGSSSKNSRHGPRFHSVLRSSRILRRHTTYYHAKQFDSLPPQASTSSLLVSTSSTKPHVHSWHRHKQSRGERERGISTQYQVSIPIF